MNNSNAGGVKLFDCDAARKQLAEIKQQLAQGGEALSNKEKADLEEEGLSLKIKIDEKCGNNRLELHHTPPGSR